MSGDVRQAIAELQDLVRCRCNPAFTHRGLHDPACNCDSADAVRDVADALAEVQALRAELADTQAKLARVVDAAWQMLIEYDDVDLDHSEPPSMKAAVTELLAAVEGAKP